MHCGMISALEGFFAAEETLLPMSVLSLELGVSLDYSHASKLRGFVGNTFRDYPILHHHVGELGYLYAYPKVQYKIISGQPFIVGIGEGSHVLNEIAPKLSVLNLGEEYNVKTKSLVHLTEVVGPCCESKAYEFLTPWLALNEENLRLYENSNSFGKQALLRKILIGNVLSFCKGISLTVKERLRAAVFLRPTPATYKGIEFTAFMGTFLINFNLPSMIGLGKGVSQGFGTLRKLCP